MRKNKLIHLSLCLGIAGIALTSCSVQGEQGPRGEQGVPGEKGEPGKDGTNLLTGSGVPSDNLGKKGDTYIDTNTGSIYSKNDSSWELMGDINIHNVDYDGFSFYPNGDGTYSVDCSDSFLLETINIPSKYFGSDVTRVINLVSYRENISTKRVVMPDTILELSSTDGSYYFESLESISFSKKLKKINKNSVVVCRSDDSIKGIKPFSCVIPSSVQTISNGAFTYRHWNSDFEDAAYIFCEAESKPLGWADGWDGGDFTIYWYSEVENADGNHWHYVGDVPTVWK